MALILNIETSTINCSVSLSKEGEIVVLKEDKKEGYSHAEKLHLFIEEVLDRGNTELNSLDAIAVSKGPGSYTGLRIGVSAVKGLCYSADLPVIAVPTLDILAKQVQGKEGFIIPVLDARRSEVYTAVFNSHHQQLEDTRAEILSETSFQNQLNTSKTYFIGNAVEKCASFIKHSNANIIEALPSAKEMASLSFDKFKNGKFEDLAYFEPFYLKDFIVIPSKK